MTKVSVIIPCYNQGAFIDEAVNSVLVQTFSDFEIIIVNDGSTDAATNALLEKYSHPKTTVIHTENQGVCAARNTAIKAAAGKYILPLDADDKIEPTYLEKAVNVLDNHPETGVVWCKADLFGAQRGEWDLKPFSLKQMMSNGCVFATAMFRKSDWERVGGYNVNMIHSLEDWDFWLSFVERNIGFYQIPEILFHYRKHAVSRTTQSIGKNTESRKNIILNHLNLYAAHPDLLRGSMAELLFSKSVSKQIKKATAFNKFRWKKGLFKYRLRQVSAVLKAYLLFPVYVQRIYKMLKEQGR